MRPCEKAVSKSWQTGLLLMVQVFVSLNHQEQLGLRYLRLPLTIALQMQAGETCLQMNLVVYFCEAAKASVCYLRKARLKVPIKVTKEAHPNTFVAACALKL